MKSRITFIAKAIAKVSLRLALVILLTVITVRCLDQLYGIQQATCIPELQELSWQEVGHEELLQALSSFNEPGHWVFSQKEAKQRLGRQEEEGLQHLLPCPSDALVQATRLADNGEVLIEIYATAVAFQDLVDIWDKSGCTIVDHSRNAGNDIEYCIVKGAKWNVVVWKNSSNVSDTGCCVTCARCSSAPHPRTEKP